MKGKKCIGENCNETAFARGMCIKHYSQFLYYSGHYKKSPKKYKFKKLPKIPTLPRKKELIEKLRASGDTRALMKFRTSELIREVKKLSSRKRK